MPNKPLAPSKIEAIARYSKKGMSIGGIAKHAKCSRPTVKKYLNSKK